MSNMALLPEWLVQLASILSDLLLAVAALVGLSGLSEWRKELLGRTKFQVAQKIVLLALQFRDEFHNARNMFGFSGEAAGRTKSPDESPDESQTRDEHYSRSQRMLLLQATLRRLHEATWEAEVVLDQEDAKLTQPFEDAFRNLALSIAEFFDVQLRQVRSPSGHLVISEARYQELDSTVYGIATDDIGKSVDQALTTLKARLRKYLR